ncbi:MAG: hypothetical protein M1327_05850 [Candidatus Thermoplasmatota archaeon]|nr:hypothetical protein [Candidatus Thermoplasmatota archaeon]
MKSYLSLKDEIIDILKQEGRQGFLQADFHSKNGFSKSRVSEILTEMSSLGQVVVRKEAGRSNRVWLPEYFPGKVSGTLRVGMLPSVEYLYHLAAIKDYCDDNRINFLLKLYQKSSDILENLIAGTLDLAFSPLVSFLIHPDNSELRIVSEVASGGSSIFENPMCSNKKIMSSEFSSMAMLTKSFQRISGQLEVVASNSPDSSISSFLSGNTRYIAIWEPFAMLLRKSSTANEVFKFSDAMDGLPCCCLGTTSGRLKESSSQIQQILNMIKKYLQRSKEEAFVHEYVKYFSSLLGVEESIVAKSLSEYAFLSGVNESVIHNFLEKLGISISGVTIKKMISFQ